VFGMLISHLVSVVIREFNVVGVPIFESETYAPLIPVSYSSNVSLSANVLIMPQV